MTQIDGTRVQIAASPGHQWDGPVVVIHCCMTDGSQVQQLDTAVLSSVEHLQVSAGQALRHSCAKSLAHLNGLLAESLFQALPWGCWQDSVPVASGR